MMDKIVKILVKAALSQATPLVGKFAVDVAGEAASGLIDARAKRQAGDLEGRMTAALARDIAEIGRREKIGEEDVERIAGVAEELLRGALTRTWADQGFRPEAAAAALVAARPDVAGRLDEHERAIVERLLTATYATLDRERGAVDDTEGAFRRAVLGRLDEIVARDLPEGAEILTAALMSLPVRPFRPDVSPPGALLRADVDRPVPFHGREDELDELIRWADGGRPLAVRLFTGRGGMGKTRLLIEACRALRARGWTAGFLDRAAARAQDEAWSTVAQGDGPLLLVVDYAEHQRALVSSVLRANLRHLGGRRTRLVLLARSGDDWWSQSRREGDGVGEVLSGPATSRVELRPVAVGVDERRRSYRLARDHFAAVLASRATAPEPAYDDPDFVRVLLLHMHALASVEGVATRGDQGILDEMLARERRYWGRRLEDVGIGAGYERAVMQSMAALTLAGGAANRGQAADVIRRLPLLAGETAVAVDNIVGLLHEVYAGERWIDPVLPDLLGEHLAQVALDDDPHALLDVVLGKRSS